MNAHQTALARSSTRNAVERLSKRLDALVEREGEFDNTELIRAMRQTYFADVDEYEKSGKLKLPE